MTDQEIDEVCIELGKCIAEELPGEIGFSLLVFDSVSKQASYISTVERGESSRILREVAARLDAATGKGLN